MKKFRFFTTKMTLRPDTKCTFDVFTIDVVGKSLEEAYDQALKQCPTEDKIWTWYVIE